MDREVYRHFTIEMRRGGGYLFQPGFSSFYDAIHGWMDGSRDEKSFMKNDHDRPQH